MKELGKESGKRTARINFRPFLFAALFFALGISVYFAVRFGGGNYVYWVFCALLVPLALIPLSFLRTVKVLLCCVGCLLFGVLFMYLCVSDYSAGKPSGHYAVQGTVETVAVYEGYASAQLRDLYFDGERADGNMQVTISSDAIRTGDIIAFSANVRRVEPNGEDGLSRFSGDIRYTATCSSFETVGQTENFLLRFNAGLYDSLHGAMSRDEADVAYALLTGNSYGIDAGLLTAIRRGGIAHIFAVSGLHIGIIFAAVGFIFKFLGKYRYFPSLAAAILYAALCGFTPSTVRAVVMCGVLGARRLLGRKTDFLSAVSVAAIIVLMISPAQLFNVGFCLSFGACLGLALFSNYFTRLFRKLPKVLGDYLSACLSVQLFTFPILLQAFGYWSVWGLLLNFFLIPALPVVFLCLFLCALFALIIPPAAFFFLFFPEGMLSLLIYLFAAADFSYVLTGFSLGTGGAVWVAASFWLSDKFRMTAKTRALSSAFLAAVFLLCVLAQNVVFVGCKFTVYDRDDATAVLVQTRSENVLVIGGDVSLRECREFLNKTYGGTLDAVVAVTEREMSAVNVAAFLNAEQVRACDEIETGLRKTNVLFGKEFWTGSLSFRYVSAGRLTLFAEGVAVEFCFEGDAVLGADLFFGAGSGDLKYFVNDGIIKEL